MKEILFNIAPNSYTLLLITFIVLVILLLLLRPQFRKYHQKKQKKALTLIKHFLIDVVNNHTDKEYIKIKIKELKKKIPLQRNYCKEMLIDEMILIKKKLSPEEAETITLVYRTLKLQKYSSSLINDSKIYKKCLGFYHYQTMNYSKGINKIMPYLKSKNQLLQSNASVAYLSLTNIATGNTLYQSKKTIKRNKEKIENLFYIQKYPYNSNIDFWLKAKKTSILLLGLKIAAHESNGNDTNAIIQLLSYKSNTVKKEALITIKKLRLQEAEATLLSLFEQFTPQLQEQSLQTLEVIGSKNTIDYLQDRMSFFESSELKNSATYCLETLLKKEITMSSQKVTC